ncbi:MAG: hypothetical protein O2820_15145 [Planctomycetota bacterium]|mgnify:CR=1 FL=1|nr:hypothetical protein [Planctomycetota bacterium]MDA1250551.1 hypothetical protein [Planctomycetota bacterium]
MSSYSTATDAKATSAPAKKKTVKHKVGAHIRVHDSVNSPDFPDISFAGWTAKVVEVSGKKAPFKYFVEWDEDIVSAIPKSYIDRCEAQQIYYRWACLTAEEFSSAK